MSNPASNPTQALWGASFRLTASEKWKSKSAAMGSGVTKALVEYSRPLPGMHVLDLASGTGEPGISLAERVGPLGSVTAVDQSSDLLQIAAERARNRNFQNFTTQQADAHHLPFADQTFDSATCRFGVMFFSDVKQALAELRRVLKPKARACFAAWGPIDQPYWQSTLQVVHRHVGGELLPRDGSDPFRFSAPGSLSKILHDSGFHDVQECTQNLPWTWPGDSQDVFDYFCAVSAPFRPLIERVREKDWPLIRTDARREIERYRVGDEIRFGADVVFASASA